jgi:hypothetical protein
MCILSFVALGMTILGFAFTGAVASALADRPVGWPKRIPSPPTSHAIVEFLPQYRSHSSTHGRAIKRLGR